MQEEPLEHMGDLPGPDCMDLRFQAELPQRVGQFWPGGVESIEVVVRTDHVSQRPFRVDMDPKRDLVQVISQSWGHRMEHRLGRAVGPRQQETSIVLC